MPTVKNTSDPYASTIISLLQKEEFRYRTIQVQAITVSNNAASQPEVVFSGTTPTHLGTHTLNPADALKAVPEHRPEIREAVLQAWDRYAPPPPQVPHLRQVPPSSSKTPRRTPGKHRA
jgi:hypothetical protein